MKKGFLFQLAALILCYWNSPLLASSKGQVLTLAQAEQLAIKNSPELKRFHATGSAWQQQAVADGQLTDPQLVVGAANVPTNSFNFSQDDMTMEQIGLQQTFARGHSLSMKLKQGQALALTEQRKAEEKALILVRSVRETWLELYYWTKALQVLHNNQTLYKNLLKVIQSQYQTGKTNQSDVLQAQIELSKLNDQVIQIQQQIKVLRTQLGRWVGTEQSNRTLALSLPRWPHPKPLHQMRTLLKNHPLLSIDAATILAAQSEAAYAKEQYKPGFLLNVGYAKRQGHFVDGMPRSDFVGAQVTIDLPIFTTNRQDRQLRASFDRVLATQLDQQVHYRDLVQILATQYVIWNSLSKREEVYKKQLIPEARQNVTVSLKSYQNMSVDLTVVLRAYSSELTIQLEQIRLEVERAQSRVVLLYLEGVAV